MTISYVDKAPRFSRLSREGQKFLLSLQEKWPGAKNNPHTTEEHLGVTSLWQFLFILISCLLKYYL